MAPFRILDPTLRDQLPPASCALAVMTKAPQAGRVKTRLVPPLTPDEAAELNKCFLRDTAAAISVCCSGGLRSPILLFRRSESDATKNNFAVAR